MASFDIVKGIRAASANLDDQFAGIDFNEALKASAVVFDGTIKRVLNTPGRGKIRRKQTKKRKKSTFIGKATRASAPGDPPAPDTGSYRRSWGFGFVRPGVIRMGTPDVRGLPLEFGTKDGRIKPRPHARVALELAKPEMIGQMGAVATVVVRKSFKNG